MVCASPLERSEARLTFGMLVQPQCRVGLALSLFATKKRAEKGGLSVRALHPLYMEQRAGVDSR